MLQLAVTKKYDEAGSFPKGDINKVAKMLNMSDEGVRKYHKKGLVFPEVKAESRIRSFDIMDFTMLLYSRSYRKCDFSLAEVEKIVNDCNVEQVRQMYEKKIQEKEEEIRQAKMILQHLKDTTASISQVSELLGKIEISEFPGLYRLEFMYSRDVWSLESEMVSRISEWAGYAPCTAISSRYSINDLLSGTQPDSSCSGLGMYPWFAEMFQVEEDKNVICVPPCKRAIHTILAADNTQLIPDMKVLIDYLRDNDLKPVSDAITLGFVNTNFDTTFTRYFHLWIPLEG